MEQPPWWAYSVMSLFVFVGILALNFIVNKFNAARIDQRFEKMWKSGNYPKQPPDQKQEVPHAEGNQIHTSLQAPHSVKTIDTRESQQTEKSTKEENLHGVLSSIKTIDTKIEQKAEKSITEGHQYLKSSHERGNLVPPHTSTHISNSAKINEENSTPEGNHNLISSDLISISAKPTENSTPEGNNDLTSSDLINRAKPNEESSTPEGSSKQFVTLSDLTNRAKPNEESTTPEGIQYLTLSELISKAKPNEESSTLECQQYVTLSDLINRAKPNEESSTPEGSSKQFVTPSDLTNRAKLNEESSIPEGIKYLTLSDLINSAKPNEESSTLECQQFVTLSDLIYRAKPNEESSTPEVKQNLMSDPRSSTETRISVIDDCKSTENRYQTLSGSNIDIIQVRNLEFRGISIIGRDMGPVNVDNTESTANEQNSKPAQNDKTS